MACLSDIESRMRLGHRNLVADGADGNLDAGGSSDLAQSGSACEDHARRLDRPGGRLDPVERPISCAIKERVFSLSSTPAWRIASE
jgi:hypothetical protein